MERGMKLVSMSPFFSLSFITSLFTSVQKEKKLQDTKIIEWGKNTGYISKARFIIVERAFKETELDAGKTRARIG